MNRSTVPRSTANRSATQSRRSEATGAAAVKAGQTPRLASQPRSRAAAALARHVFLCTDDTWSLGYFTPGDPRYLERVLLGRSPQR